MQVQDLPADYLEWLWETVELRGRLHDEVAAAIGFHCQTAPPRPTGAGGSVENCLPANGAQVAPGSWGDHRGHASGE